MAQWLMQHKAREYDEVCVLFANTGQENHATLDFVDRCDREFGLGVVWLEAVVHHGQERSCSHAIVNFHTADRAGRVFEEVIKKYGIPNKAYPHCTRELKLNVMRSYLLSIGWEAYDSAVGIRADEIDRMRDQRGLLYPLISMCPMTKPEINRWWREQPFRLPLKGYEGNCRWCWKKTDRKLATIARETPEAFDFPARMERDFGLAGHRNSDDPGHRRTFFRQNRSTQDIMALAKSALPSAVDDSRQYAIQRRMFDPTAPEIDEADNPGAGCTESCEAFV